MEPTLDTDQARYRALMRDAYRGMLTPDGFQEVERLRKRMGEPMCSDLDHDICAEDIRRTA